MNECHRFPEPWNFLCAVHDAIDQRHDTIKMQLHVTAGVISGLLFILLTLIVGLFIRWHKLQTDYISRRMEEHEDPKQFPHVDIDASISHLHINDFNEHLPSPQLSINEYDADYNTPLDHSSAPKKVRFLPRILPGFGKTD